MIPSGDAMSRALEARDEKPSTKTKIIFCAQCGKDVVLRAESVSMAAWTATDAARIKAVRDRARLVAALREAMHQVTKAEDCRAIQDLLVSIGEIK